MIHPYPIEMIDMMHKKFNFKIGIAKRILSHSFWQKWVEFSTLNSDIYGK